MVRAVGPSEIVFGLFPWGVAPDWYSVGPLALPNICSPHQQGPKARPIQTWTRPRDKTLTPPARAKGLSHTRPGQGPGIQHPCPPKGLKARPIRSTPTMRKTVPILSWTATTLTPSITRSLSSLSRPALIPVGAYSTRLRNFPQIKDHQAGYRTLRSTRGCGRSYSGGTRSPRSRRSLARGSW